MGESGPENKISNGQRGRVINEDMLALGVFIFAQKEIAIIKRAFAASAACKFSSSYHSLPVTRAIDGEGTFLHTYVAVKNRT